MVRFSSYHFQLVKNEPGSRVVQQIIKNGQDMQLVLAILRWLEENIQEVVLSKPAVHLALVVLEILGAESRNNQAWAARLYKFILHFTKPEVRREISFLLILL